MLLYRYRFTLLYVQ